MLQKPEASGRLLKWVIKLGKSNVNFNPRTTIKGQALANFIVEFTYASTVEVPGIVEGVEAVNAVKVGDNEDSATPQEESNNGPSIWMAPLIKMDLEKA